MFSEKRIKVEVDLMETVGKLLFATNSVVFDDFRVDLEIKKVFSPVGPTANIKIYGVSKEHMNQITTIALRDTIEISHKRVRVWVDNGKGYVLLFEGCIVEAIPVYDAVPDCYIQIESSVAAYENAMSPPPNSFPSKQVATSFICQSICASYGVPCYADPELYLDLVSPIQFNQNGLSARMAAACEAYNLEAVRTGTKYEVYKKGRVAKTVWNFTPDNIDGYPSYANKLIKIKTDDFADIEVLHYFRIKNSEIPFANGLWYIVMIQYKLQSRTPNGKWEATLFGAPQREGKLWG